MVKKPKQSNPEGTKPTGSGTKKPGQDSPEGTNPPDLAERVKVLRETMGWTMGQLARRFGVSPGAVSQWESGTQMSGPAIKLLEVYEKKATKFEEG